MGIGIKHEHDLIERVLALLSDAAHALQGGGHLPVGFQYWAVDFIRRCADGRLALALGPQPAFCSSSSIQASAANAEGQPIVVIASKATCSICSRVTPTA